MQDVLAAGELVKEIHVPKLHGTVHYDKKRVRDAIDFAIVSLASCIDVQDSVIRDARIVYGGVAPVPYRMKDVEELLKGKAVSEALADEAAKLAVSAAVPMGKNEYKLYMMKDLMRAAVLRAAE